MSAPAAARASAPALPIPRRQPVTRRSCPPGRSDPVAARRPLQPRQSIRIFTAGEPSASSAITLREPLERLHPSDQRLDGQAALREQLDRPLVVLGLVDSRALQLELLPEEVEQVDGLRVREDRDDDDSARAARGAATSSRGPSGCRARHLEDHVCPCAFRQPRDVLGEIVRPGSMTSKPRASASSRRVALTSLTITRRHGIAPRARRGDRSAPSDHHRHLAVGKLRPSDVVAGKRERLGSGADWRSTFRAAGGG